MILCESTNVVKVSLVRERKPGGNRRHPNFEADDLQDRYLTFETQVTAHPCLRSISGDVKAI